MCPLYFDDPISNSIRLGVGGGGGRGQYFTYFDEFIWKMR